MFLRPLGARNLPVRDIADQDVLERELRLAVDRAAPRALHELLLLQRMQLLLADTERAEPEHLADHRRVLQQPPSPPAASPSRRAAMIPCTDSGRSTVVPRSASMRTYCSA